MVGFGHSKIRILSTKQFKEMEKINSISLDKTNKILKLFGMKTVYVISGVRII